jgi:hypothetical protein
MSEGQERSKTLGFNTCHSRVMILYALLVKGHHAMRVSDCRFLETTCVFHGILADPIHLQKWLRIKMCSHNCIRK